MAVEGEVALREERWLGRGSGMGAKGLCCIVSLTMRTSSTTSTVFVRVRLTRVDDRTDGNFSAATWRG